MGFHYDSCKSKIKVWENIYDGSLAGTWAGCLIQMGT